MATHPLTLQLDDEQWDQLALAARDRGEIGLAPPTWVTLHTLSSHRRVAELVEHARSTPPEHFTTRPARTDAGAVLLWHGDVGYEGGDVSAPGPRHRLWMGADGWRYERNGV